MQGSNEGLAYRGMQVTQHDLHLQMGGVITVQTFRVKRRYQLVVRLKANKYYQELLRYLSSYINLLNIRFFARISGLCISVTNNIMTPGFVLIVSLIISLWLLWSYCWLDCFNCSDLIADCIALIVLFDQVLALSYLEVRAVQDVIHHPDKSHTYICLFSRTHLHTLNCWII